MPPRSLGVPWPHARRLTCSAAFSSVAPSVAKVPPKTWTSSCEAPSVVMGVNSIFFFDDFEPFFAMESGPPRDAWCDGERALKARVRVER